ncbi:molybdopterin-dependent oxidoreductase, partial [Ralstonia pseudosolanacearum]
GIAGDPAHPANAGRLCVKGSALGETVGLDGRLLHPAMRERTPDPDAPPAPLRRVAWDAALDAVAQGFRRIVDEHGPDAVALYVSGQLLTEDYYLANKLMKGFIGSANIDTNSRLCMSSAVAGHKRAFGEDLVPVCYDDLEAADLIVLVGSNTAWCHPILFQRIVRVKEARPEVKVVVVDPRHTATCELADLHLPIRPGTDVRLFNGLLSFLARRGAVDRDFVDLHTSGLDDALRIADADADDVAEVARACKLKLDDLLTFYGWFADTPRTITAFSQGVNQSSAGTDKVNSIINCHLLTGRIGHAGMGPFSITGQPNAMGGREVGGLANMLAAHLELYEPRHRELVQTFWNAPRMADKVGLKAVDLFSAIEAGRVKAVWIMGTNPVVSLPDADQVRRALAKCELVVASDIVEATDTTLLADIVLPALGWGEKNGTVTNSERRISRQRAFLPAPGEARADWDIIADVARRMGYDGFDFKGPHDVFDEHARLSAFANGPQGVRRAFHLGGLTGLDADAYDGMAPVQWPVTLGGAGEARLFSDGRFAHADGRARFVPTAARAPVHAPDSDYPLILNTGRVRDQWHTMTRTGRAPKLADHVPEPFVDLHPHDALLAGVREGA